MDQKDLRRIEARCTQEEPPRCRAACPLHVDVRAFCAFMADKKSDKALAVLARSLPLPLVAARICDAPCRDACLRAEAGGAVRLDALERACVDQASRPPRLMPMPAKGGTVAVAGGGLAGLCAAWELGRRGFSVTLLGVAPAGILNDFSADELPPEVLAGELDRLRSLRVALDPGEGLDFSDFARIARELGQKFDAVFLDPEVLPGAAPELGPARPVGLDCSVPGVFVSDLPGERETSPAYLAALGRRAANSIERFVQGASLTAGRENEAPGGTRLFTSLKDVESVPPVPGKLDPDKAASEAARCLQCQCLECVKACPYLERHKAYPKTYARQIYNNLAIVMGTRQANTLINSCMLCGQCTEICPEDFDMAALCLSARQEMVRDGHMPPSAHEFALDDMAFSNSDHFFMARPGPEPKGRGRDMLFFPGCQLCGSSPGQVEAAYGGLLKKYGPGVGLMLGCCGAPGLWAGREDLFAETMDMVRREWTGLGRPRLVLACSSCLEMFSRGLPEAGATSLWELYASDGLPPGGRESAGMPGPLAVHDPCTARHQPEMRRAARDVLADLGAMTVELDHAGELASCCGFGGLLFNADPELADEAAARRGREYGGDYAAYCAMCRDRLARSGKRVLHILDIVFPDPARPDPASRPDPGFSVRRDNRAGLRAGILETIWNENGSAPSREREPEINMAPETAARLEARRILVSDVRAAIGHAQATGRKFADPESGRFLARHRPVNVTFWVEYSVDGQGFTVHNSWCHRMEVKEDGP